MGGLVGVLVGGLVGVLLGEIVGVLLFFSLSSAVVGCCRLLLAVVAVMAVQVAVLSMLPSLGQWSRCRCAFAVVGCRKLLRVAMQSSR